jgi:hypothetical protein
MELNENNRRFQPASNDIFVDVPPVHQGVADALRSVFTPIKNRLPDEIESLLDKLR